MLRSALLMQLLLSLANANSRVCKNCEGTDFVLIFPENYEDTSKNVLFIHISTTSDVPANVRCFSPNADSTNLTFDRALKVSRLNVTTVEVPDEFELLGNEIAVKSVRITSDREIFVYAANARPYSGDMFLVFPTTRIGQNYIAAAMESDIDVHVNVPVVAVAAVNIETLVSFHFKSNITIAFTNGQNFSGNVFSIELYQYEVVHIKHLKLSGTIIIADKDIVVVSGSTCFRDASYYGITTKDHVAEQLLPVKYMSKKYIVVPSSVNDTESGEIVRIYSTESETNIIQEYNGSTNSYVLHEVGDSIDFFLTLSSASIFTADKDISVVQFGVSSTHLGDPYMLLTTPFNAFMRSYEFFTFANYNYESISHRLVLIANNVATESTFLDILQLNPMDWTSIGKNFFINIPISEGAHKVYTLADGGFLWGFVYGRKTHSGYASSIGRYLCESGNCPGDGEVKVLHTGNGIEASFHIIERDKVPSVIPLKTDYTTLLGCGRICKSLSNCAYFTFQESTYTCKTFNSYIWCNSMRIENVTDLYEKRDMKNEGSSGNVALG